MSYKSHRFILSFAALLLCGTLCMETAHGHSATPPVGHTGAPGHLTCFECHKGTGTTGGVSLSFSGNTNYTAGQMYSLMVTVADPTKIRFGFSMVARDTDNNLVDVGTWAAGGSDTQVYGTGNTHVGHKNAPFASGTHTFTVNWTAPSASVGDVTFYVAGNAANGNGLGLNDTGDNIYTNTLTITEALPPNLPPSLTVPVGTLHTLAELPSTVTGVSIDDPDSGGGDLSVTLTVANGVITLSDSVAGGVAAGDIVNNGSASVMVSGTVAELNATFGASDGITYTGGPGYLGSDTLSLLADDQGNTGSGGAQTDNASISISVNAPPVLSDLTILPSGDVQFLLTGTPSLSYAVDFSKDLQNWLPLTSVTLVSSTELVTDTSNSLTESRFYRASQTSD